jgi:hypothetical protein
MIDHPRRCVVLVPVGAHIEPSCEASLHELELRGYTVWRVRGYSAIDQGRNQLATDALAAGFQETMWIDSDVSFNPDDVDKLRSHNLPITCGICVKKGKRELAIHVLEGTELLVFGPKGGLTEIRYAGTGFLHVRASVYHTIREQLKLPICNLAWSHPMLPFFQPMIKEEPWGSWYLAEDFAFSERARRCGYRVIADKSFRLGHIGSYTYTWEDAGSDALRYANYTYHLGSKPKAPGPAQLALSSMSAIEPVI